MIIESTGDVSNHKLKVLIYGQSGAGKTTLASTLDPKTTLIISNEAGTLSVSHKNIPLVNLSRISKTEFTQDPVVKMKNLNEIFKKLYENHEDVKHVKNVFLDSLSEISEIIVEALQKQYPDRKDSMVLWGENAKKMQSVVKSFRDLQYNVFMTCMSDKEKDEVGRVSDGFMISGKMGQKLPQYFDEVFYLTKHDDGKRELHTRGTERRVCKDRSNKLEPVEAPDLSLIMHKILFTETKEKKENV